MAGGDSEALRLSKSAKTMSDIALLREFARYFKTQSGRHEYLPPDRASGHPFKM